MKCMKSVAHSLIGAAQSARNCGRRLPLGTGKEDLAAAHGKGGRRPETGLQGCPLVRRERAYKEGRLHTQEYTTCPKTSIGGALGPLPPAPTHTRQSLSQRIPAPRAGVLGRDALFYGR